MDAHKIRLRRTNFSAYLLLGVVLLLVLLFVLPLAAPAFAHTGFIYDNDQSHTLVGHAHADNIWAYGGNDILYGLESGDVLLGGNGDDRLYGGPGPDILDGGPGNDVCVGGGGSDQFKGTCEVRR